MVPDTLFPAGKLDIIASELLVFARILGVFLTEASSLLAQALASLSYKLKASGSLSDAPFLDSVCVGATLL